MRGGSTPTPPLSEAIPTFAFQSPASSSTFPVSEEQTRIDLTRCCLTLCYICHCFTPQITHFNRGGGPTTAATAVATQTTTTTIQAQTFRKKKLKRIVGKYFGSWVRCLNEFTKKICNNCHVCLPGLVSGKCHLSRNTHTHRTDTHIQRQTRERGVRRRWCSTLKHHSADSSWPQERQSSSQCCSLLTQTLQTGNRKDYFYCDTLQLTAHY